MAVTCWAQHGINCVSIMRYVKRLNYSVVLNRTRRRPHHRRKNRYVGWKYDDLVTLLGS